ncbi:hypothetical protein MTO96_001274 [Rhipicephalus appendiculatus]
MAAAGKRCSLAEDYGSAFAPRRGQDAAAGKAPLLIENIVHLCEIEGGGVTTRAGGGIDGTAQVLSSGDDGLGEAEGDS